EEFLPHKSEGQKQNAFTDAEGKTSFGMSVFNLSNAIMGSGILGLAYAMSNTGIILFTVLLTCIAVLSSYSIHLLLKSAGVVGIRAYEQLGYRAFGHPGKVAAACIITIHNIGTMSSYLFIVKSELPLVIQAFLGLSSKSGQWYLQGDYLIIIVSIVFILPLAVMRHLGYLGYTSGFSLSCMMFFLISVREPAKGKLREPFTACGQHDHMEPRVSLLSLLEETCPSRHAAGLTCAWFALQAAYTIPILAFAFVCHPEVLPIYTELREPTRRRMQNVANISIVAMFVMYFLTAVFGYLTFYATVEAELLHTYIQVDPLDTVILCVRLAVLMAVTLTVPVVLFPIRRAVQQLLCPEKPFHWARHIGIAVCFLFLVNLLVIYVPNIRDIFGLIGATSAPSLIFILPGIFYLRIVPNDKEPMNSRPKIQAACFAALGFLFMVMSLTFIFIDWASGESHNRGGH
uniref:Solute carrier family 38 member 5 n=1 Tax=Scleropages formosus TaxID=113540 RepID=A0A8C9VRC4_SCLFO